MVVDEDFDTERVIVDLRCGHYFCVNEAGSWLWQALERGPLSVPSLAQSLADKQAASADEIAASIETWASVLEKATLLQIDRTATAPASTLTSGDLPPVWLAPTVSVYGDLEHLLALDPIHEVDQAAGWPQEKTEASPKSAA